MLDFNTNNLETAFNVSADHVDTSTGISAIECAFSIRKLVEGGSRFSDFIMFSFTGKEK